MIDLFRSDLKGTLLFAVVVLGACAAVCWAAYARRPRHGPLPLRWVVILGLAYALTVFVGALLFVAVRMHDDIGW